MFQAGDVAPSSLRELQLLVGPVVFVVLPCEPVEPPVRDGLSAWEALGMEADGLVGLEGLPYALPRILPLP